MLVFVVFFVTRLGIGIVVTRVVDDLLQSRRGNIGEYVPLKRGDIGGEGIAAVSWLHLEE